MTNHLQKKKKCLIMRSFERIFGDTQFHCSKCDKSFSQETLIHMAIHTGKKPDPCTKCGKAFSQKVILKYHMTIHCDKFFLEK